eukprot:scaffold182783_cov17-Tisochrysis_lutea.AAC.1
MGSGATRLLQVAYANEVKRRGRCLMPTLLLHNSQLLSSAFERECHVQCCQQQPAVTTRGGRGGHWRAGRGRGPAGQAS